MLNKFITYTKNIDPKIKTIIIKGFKISFFICLIATYILSLYIAYPASFITYNIGLILFKASLIFAVSFVIIGSIINKIKNK